MSADNSRASSTPPPIPAEGDGEGRSGDGERDGPLNQASTSVKTQVEGLVDMLAWIRIELSAKDPTTPFTMSQRVRIKRALVQVEMALAMAKELANELRLARGKT